MSKGKKTFTWKASLVHALEWRVYALIIDFFVVYALTGKLDLSLGIASISALLRTLAHAAWVKVKFRRVTGDVY